MGKDVPPTVWLVDANPGTKALIRYLLSSDEASLAHFSSAAEFFKSYDVSVPGCVIAASRLPDMSGVELAEKLAQRCAVPVILLGNGGGPTEAGCFAFIEFPSGEAKLAETIRSAIELNARQREPIA
jgi:FixJ family two-component response regulator